jgi:UDP-N-acetylmuramoylalanine--D-glutamate ligase
VGITGSSGKTTTTTLVGKMLRAAGQSTWVGGNIGTPLIDRVFEINANDRIVLELSSFQLQLFDASPQVSAVLNITPNHLDRHPSMAHYTASKANILRYQSTTDVAVLGVDNPITGRWWREGRVEVEADAGQPTFCSPLQAQRLGFSMVQELAKGAFLRRDRLVWRGEEQEAEICSIAELQLLGRHNVANVLAACAISGPAGATPEAMRHVATTFAGVSHRLEWVRDLRGVRWYNDSIATTPERVVAALESFDAPLVLLAGGRDKHLPWQEMADLAYQRVRHLVLFGEAATLIAREMQAAQRRSADQTEFHMHRCCTLEQAVELAARVARAGDTVLLSPGGTSFDAYRDFEERGNHYRRLVHEL